MRKLLLLFPLLVLVTGCETYSMGASSTGTVPLMPSGANFQRWEHLCVAAYGLSAITDILNKTGDEGWEMVGLSEHVICFKRPKVQVAAAPAPAPAPESAKGSP